jgi:hypothetical protein
MNNNSIGFFFCREKDNAFSGAVLITDHRGIPVEFKYTDPIIPSRYQRSLFGKVLEPYIRKQIIGKNLIERIESKFSIIVVCQDILKDLQEEFNFPVIFIEASSKKMGLKEEIIEEDGNLKVKNFDKNGTYEITVAKEYVKRVSEEILLFSRHMNLIEPFDRIKTTLEDLAAEYSEIQKKEGNLKKQEQKDLN